MSKQRVVKDEIWDDEWFYDLLPDEKLIWLFLLTNPRTNIAGVYKANARWIAGLTGFTKEEVVGILQKFVRDGKILYESDWIALTNFHKHLPYDNPNIRKGIRRIYDECIPYTKALKGFETLWVTLLNLTLLNLSVGEDSSSQLEVKKN